MILWSSLKEGKGPALYLCPNNHLVSQVQEEATNLGIPCAIIGSGNRIPAEFHDSSAILITSVHRLFNGRSIFGVAGERDSVQVGVVLVDDAHSCIDIARDQFTISVPKSGEIGQRIYGLFETALEFQAVGLHADIRNHQPNSYIQVPYWAWRDRVADVAKLLSDHQDSDEVGWVWPLLRQGDILSNSTAVISGHRVEISPNVIPTDLIPSFSQARHKIYMSATLVDDAKLVRDFGAESNSIQMPIRPAVRGDIGERAVIIPSLVDPRIEETTTVKLVSEIQALHNVNVVVLVPSRARGQIWTSENASQVTRDNIVNVLGRLSNDGAHTAILANRYDGIDLPDAACRILVLDELPREHRLAQLVEGTARQDSPIFKRRLAQKIEQGMGRGVRSRLDYCFVVITGQRLVSFMTLSQNQEFFTADTKRQIAIGTKLARALKDQSGNAYQSVVPVLGS